jgi:hypothetical protein
MSVIHDDGEEATFEKTVPVANIDDATEAFGWAIRDGAEAILSSAMDDGLKFLALSYCQQRKFRRGEDEVEDKEWKRVEDALGAWEDAGVPAR